MSITWSETSSEQSTDGSMLESLHDILGRTGEIATVVRHELNLEDAEGQRDHSSVRHSPYQ